MIGWRHALAEKIEKQIPAGANCAVDLELAANDMRALVALLRAPDDEDVRQNEREAVLRAILPKVHSSHHMRIEIAVNNDATTRALARKNGRV